MFPRLLLAPDSPEGSPPAAPTPATPPPPTPQTPPSAIFAQPPRAEGQPPIAAPVMVPMPMEEYQNYQGMKLQIAEYKREQAVALEAAEAKAIKALADKGQIEEALARQQATWEAKHAEARAQTDKLQAAWYGERKTAVMNDALGGITYVGETPEEQAATRAFVARSMAEDFEVVTGADGIPTVREKASGRPAAEAIRERLSRPPYTALIASQRGGGSGSDGTRPPANGQQPQPGSLDAVVANWQRNQAGIMPAIGLKAR